MTKAVEDSAKGGRGECQKIKRNNAQSAVTIPYFHDYDPKVPTKLPTVHFRRSLVFGLFRRLVIIRCTKVMLNFLEMLR